MARHEPGRTYTIEVPACEPTLHRRVKRTRDTPQFTFELPVGFSPEKPYPLYAIIGGGDGGNGRRADFANEQKVFGRKTYVFAHFPLFQRRYHREASPAGGLMLSFYDAEALSVNLGRMLKRLRRIVPGIDRARSCLGGFSNGAHATAILLTMRDRRVVPHFKNVVLLEGGVFQLADLFSPTFRDINIFMAQGQYCYAGEGVCRMQCDVVSETARKFHVNLSRAMMWDTGHAVSDGTLQLAKTWLRDAGRKRRGRAMREELEREWQFNAQLRATVRTDSGEDTVSVSIHNPFTNAFGGRLRVTAVEGGWSGKPNTRRLAIAPGETKRAALKIRRTGEDWDKLPQVILEGTRTRDLTGLIRRAFGGKAQDAR